MVETDADMLFEVFAVQMTNSKRKVAGPRKFPRHLDFWEGGFSDANLDAQRRVLYTSDAPRKPSAPSIRMAAAL